MYGMFSVPARRPASWCPPISSGRQGVPGLMYSTPMPLGACSLCPEKESKSTCRYSCGQIDPHLAHRLRGVAMEDDRRIGFLGQPGELLDGKDDARLVVGVHDAHQQRFGAQGADELADVEIAVAVDVQPGDAAAVALEILADLQHGRVLDRRGDDVPPVADWPWPRRRSPCCCSRKRSR